MWHYHWLASYPGSFSFSRARKEEMGLGTRLTTDDSSQTVQCETCGSWSHLHCAGLAARSAKEATFKFHICNPSVQKKSQRASNTKTSKASNSSNSTNPAVTTSTPAATPAPPNAALGEGNASSATILCMITVLSGWLLWQMSHSTPSGFCH